MPEKPPLRFFSLRAAGARVSWTLNPLVVGSIPTRPTNTFKGLASKSLGPCHLRRAKKRVPVRPRKTLHRDASRDPSEERETKSRRMAPTSSFVKQSVLLRCPSTSRWPLRVTAAETSRHADYRRRNSSRAITNDGEKESRNNFPCHGYVCPEALRLLVILAVMHNQIADIECGS